MAGHNENHALILGASGISGWALLNAVRAYPTPQTWSRITATTNRPLSLEQAYIPEDSRINLVNGIDFTKSVDEVKSELPKKIPGINSVTHVFFTAYITKSSFEELRSINVDLVHTAISAISSLAPGLCAVILQTGGKAYGVEFTAELGNPKTPLRESAPRIPAPQGEKIFYYPQVDTLRDLAKDAPWTFTEIRPDVIIGFVPGDNAMDCARGLALYLTLQRRVRGDGATVPFPGTQGSWKNRHTDTSQDILAKMEIHAALDQAQCGSKQGEAFNIADGAVTTWSEKWPALCKYFGLEGAGPAEDGKGEGLLEFVEKHKGKWADVVKENGLKANVIDKYDFNFLYFVMVVFDFDREYDLSKAKSVGFNEQIDTVKGYTTAFDRLKKAGIIPA